MSAPRFYVPQLAQVTSGFLDGAEARHATSVLRLNVDDQVTLFDGLGAEALARIVSTGRSQLAFEVIERLDRNRELVHPLTLAIALPKGDRQRTLVDAATELGVTHFIPLRTQRGVAQPTDNALERLGRSVTEASKQCGRNRLMHIGAPQSVAELIEHQPHDSCLRLVAHPRNEAGPRAPLRRLLVDPVCAATIAIGPEGGFTNDEVQQLTRQHWQAIDLGPTILRVEIAAIAAIAQLAAWLQPDATASASESSSTGKV